MKKIEELRKLSSKELAQWICHNVLKDRCDECPLTNECSRGHNPIEKIFDEDQEGVKDLECVGCKHLFDCPGRLNKSPCVRKEE